jgi:hypothetical protein
MGQVLRGSATTTEAVRRAIHHSQASLRVLAKRYGINQKTAAKWKGADLGRRSADWAEETQIDGPDHGGRGGGHRFPQAYPVAARRLPLRLAADPRASDALVSPSLSAAPRRQPIASDGGRQRAAEEVQDLSDRLLPRRHRRRHDPPGLIDELVPRLAAMVDGVVEGFEDSVREPRPRKGSSISSLPSTAPSKFAVAQLVHKANTRTARAF